MLSSIFTEGATTITISELLICILASIILGLLVAFTHMYRNVVKKHFIPSKNSSLCSHSSRLKTVLS